MPLLSKAPRPHMSRTRFFLAKNSSHEASKLSSHDSSGWAAGNEVIDDGNTLWRQYVIFVDLYRYYIDLVWKVTIWYYTATGVSLAYFLAHLNGGHHGYLPLLLLFLGAISVGVSLIYIRAISSVNEMECWLEHIAVSLHLPGRPHVEFLRSFCRFSSVSLFLIAASCFSLFGYLRA